MPNLRKHKVCSICGKSEGPHWSRHWTQRHPNNKVSELELGQLPSHPFDESWLYLIEPEALQEQYKKGLQVQVQEVPPTEVAAEEDGNEVISQVIQPVHPPTQYIEIDDVAEGYDSKEEVKEGEAINDHDDDQDLTSLHTQTLFKKAQRIVEIIQQRVAAREKLLRDRLKFALRSPKMIQEVEVRHLYPASGGNHLAMSRVIPETCASSSYPDRILSSIQFGVKERIHPSTQFLIDELIREEKRVKQTFHDLGGVVDTLHSISIPTSLTINNSNAEIQVVEQALTIRNRNILKRTWQEANNSKAPSEPLPIEYTPPADPVAYCPLLYGPALDNAIEDEQVGPEVIKTSEIDSGDDLTEGVLAIDGVRFLLSKVRNEVKGIKYLDLKDDLLGLVEHWQAYIKRRLQYFIEMVLFPLFGYGKHKLRIHFDGCWLDPREFTINVKPHDRRGFCHNSAFFLRSLQEVTQEISAALFTIIDLTTAFNNLTIEEEEQYELLDSLIKQIHDSISSLKSGKDMELIHKINHLESTMTTVAQHLKEPELLQHLKEKEDNQKFWTTVDLQALVRSRIQNQDGATENT